jgi:pimeloyl-ACP methyl ester carboxylesterase
MIAKPQVQQIKLTDGRYLAWSEFGAAQGHPVLYCHSLPGSRLEAVLADAPTRSLGIRLIAVDRPGMGLSSLAPGRSITDWPKDIVALVDALGIERFHVLGVSGGGPYALACAALLPDHINRVALVSPLGSIYGKDPWKGMGLTSRLMLSGAARSPILARSIARFVGLALKHAPRASIGYLGLTAGSPDASVLAEPLLRDALIDSWREAFRNGSAGPAEDLSSLTRPWGFALESIRLPVRLWHGLRDRVVPAVMVRALERQIPTCSACYLDTEGHYSLVMRYLWEILDELQSDKNWSNSAKASRWYPRNNRESVLRNTHTSDRS